MKIDSLPSRRPQRVGRRSIAAGLTLLLSVTVVSSVPAPPEKPWEHDSPAPMASVPGNDVAATEPGSDPTAGSIMTEPPKEPLWPSAATRSVAAVGTLVDVGGLPVSVSAVGSDVLFEVTTHDQATSERLGIDGVVVGLQAEDPVDDAEVTIGYEAFKTAFGADWSTRLRLTELTGCDTSTAGSCVSKPVPTTNNVHTDTLSAIVDVSADTLFAVSASASGAAGDYAASSLSSSQSWSAGGSAGGFTWSYPVNVPAAIGGPDPAVALSYSSQSVDGRTAASNNQPSWIGEGFEFHPGFIERKYISCASDMDDGANNVEKTGDLCWHSDNAVMSIGSVASELIRDDDTGQWRMKTDDNSKIELLTGGPNGDDDGEYWVVTTPDGTKLWFGRNQLPGWTSGAEETNSTLTVPVFGNHSGEPCHAAAFSDSDCRQAWRWQLDYIEDVWGNSTSYWYGIDTNRYSRNGDVNDAASYDRDGFLKRIDYGTRTDTAYGTAPFQVVFTTQDRCISSCEDKKAANWPDTPWDQECTSAPCTDVYTPTFWSDSRLATITTKVWVVASYRDIDSYSLRHSFRDPGDGTRAGLFLEGITHTGHTNGNLESPEVTFTGLQMPNRVDGIDNAPPMNWFRVGSIHTETGAEIGVHYRDAECSADGNLPSDPATNTRLCFPVWWNPAEYGDPEMDWFHKYVVESVTVTDHTGGYTSPRTVTSYEYVGDPAWHYTDGNGFLKEEHRTWSQWRGFEKVTTTIGDPDDSPLVSQTQYYRGMNGDKDPDGGAKTVTLTDSRGTTVTDHADLVGRPREQLRLDSATMEPLSSVITDWWTSDPTASMTVADRTVHARYSGAESRYYRTALDDDRGWQEVATHTTFDTYGMPIRIEHEGDVDVAGDEKCTVNTYTRNPSKMLLLPVSQVETYSMPCGREPSSEADVIGITRMSFDGQAYGQAPTHGGVTEVATAQDWEAATFEVTNGIEYDLHGRVTSRTDATGATTTTAFTPTTGGPVRQIATTNELGWTTTTYLEPLRGQVTYDIDHNGKRTDYNYDAVGRLTKVWLPNRATNLTPNIEYTYLLRNDGPSVVSTSRLIHNGNYVTGHVLYDSMLRERQSQSPAVGGGRVISDVFYDTVGRAFKSYDSWIDATTEPGTQLVEPEAETMVSAVYRSEFDGAGRPVAEIFETLGQENWRTTLTHHGDRVTVVPPDGGTTTSTITDTVGRTIELRQHHGRGADTDYDATTYDYDSKGQLTTVTDPVGNQWSYEYDFQGRVTATNEPDRGQTTFTYDLAGRVVTTTDARGETIAYTYDPLSRITSVRDDSIDGAVRSEWTYDTVTGAKGLPAAATRYVGGAPYRIAITGYDQLYQPLGTSYVIPEGHGDLSGTYTFRQTYKQDGSPNTRTLPAMGGLAHEVLQYYYDDTLGLPTQLGTSHVGISGYVMATEYNALGMLQRIEQSTKALSSSTVFQTFEYETGTRRLERMVTSRQPTTPNRLQELTFTYDDYGNVTRIGDKPEVATDISGRNEVQCFEYDYLQRLTEAWTPDVDDCSLPPSEDSLGGPAPYWQSYDYDEIGNRTSLVKHASPGSPGTTTTDYTTPGPGRPRPHAVTATETTTETGTFTHTYQYDDAGNMVSRPDGLGGLQDLTWDAEGRLSAVTDADTGDEVASYIYGPDGQRLISTDENGTTLHLGGTELHADNETGAVTGTRYYTHLGMTVAVRTVDGLTWLTADHQGTAGLAISDDVTTYEQRRQDPFGNPRGQTPATWPDEKGFLGGDTDPTGLTHLSAREYDPSLGRFISVDPIVTGDPQQAHGYAYAENTPVTQSDPSGLCAICVINHDGGPAGRAMQSAFLSAGGGQHGATGGRSVDCQETYEVICFGTDLFFGFGEALIPIDVRALDECMQAGGDACSAFLFDLAVSALTGVFGKMIGKAVGAFAGALSKLIKNWDDIYAGIMGRAGKKADDAADAASDAADAGKNAGKKKPDEPGGDKDKPKDEPDGKSGDGPKNDDGSHNCNCFTEGTPVAMADGSTKSIEEVEPGDEVVTYNTDTGEQETHVVTALFSKPAEVLVEITVTEDTASGEDPAGERVAGEVSGTDPPASSGSLTVTPEHPFWEPVGEAWTPAGDLQPGDRLLQRDGDLLTITGITTLDRTESFTVYNFTVAGTHNYYATTLDTLVHNCGKSKEEVLPQADYFEQARNTALEKLGTIDAANREIREGRMKTASSTFGKVIGFETWVDGVWKQFRLDYDPVKGPHINVAVGKGAEGRKWAVPWKGTEQEFIAILKGNT